MIVAGLMVYVVPKVVDVFEANHAKLPLATRAESAVPGITYASMNVTVEPIDSAFEKRADSTGGNSSSSSSSAKKSSTAKSGTSKK